MDLLPEIAARFGVHARRGFVEQKQFRLVNHTRRQGEALLPAAGELAGKLVLPFREPEPLKASTHGLPAVLYGIHAADEIEVLRNAQVLVETESLGHVADLALDHLALADDVIAEARAASLVGTEQAAQHADEGRLAAAVWAEKAANFACRGLAGRHG